jgi:hypothetical protein
MLDPKEVIDALILSGAIEIDSLDPDTGQFIYKINEKLSEVAPEIWRDLNEQVHRDIMSLWEKGLLLMDVTAQRPVVAPSEIALDRASWKHLSNSEYSTMNIVMKAFEGGT